MTPDMYKGIGVVTDFLVYCPFTCLLHQIRVRKNNMVENETVQTLWYINSSPNDLLVIKMPCQV